MTDVVLFHHALGLTDGIRSFADEGDLDAARELVATTDHAELFVYDGDQHYFADLTLPSYRPEAARLLMSRVLAFLDTVA